LTDVSEVLSAFIINVIMVEAVSTSEMSVIWDVVPYSLVDIDPCFRDAYCLHHQDDARAVPWLRSLVAGLLPRWPGLAPRSINMGFVVDKVALGQVFLRVLRFFPVSVIPPSLSKLMSSGECVIC
jgi:hypothetical protein